MIFHNILPYENRQNFSYQFFIIVQTVIEVSIPLQNFALTIPCATSPWSACQFLIADPVPPPNVPSDGTATMICHTLTAFPLLLLYYIKTPLQKPQTTLVRLPQGSFFLLFSTHTTLP